MDTENFCNEYLVDVEFSGLPHIMHGDHDDGQILGIDEHHFQLGQFTPGKGLFDDNDGTVSPSWLSHMQFEPTSNPESSGGPSPGFSGSVDEDMGPLLADTITFEDDHGDLSRLLASSESELKQNPEPPSSLATKADELHAAEGSNDDVLLKREELDDVLISPASSGPAAMSVRKRRKRSTAGSNDKVRRQKFLERNRVAASKCRRKKKEAEQALEGLQKQMEDDHMALKALRASLVSEFADLQKLLMAHSGCGSAATDQWLATGSTRLEGILGKESLDPELNKPLLGDRAEDDTNEPLNMQHEPATGRQTTPRAAQHAAHHTVYQTPRALLQHQSLITDPFQSQGHQMFDYESSPQLCPEDFSLLMSPSKHMRNASLASSLASMTSYSSDFTTSDLGGNRKSSTGSVGSSYKLSPTSPMYADFPESITVDLIKPEPALELLAEATFDTI